MPDPLPQELVSLTARSQRLVSIPACVLALKRLVSLDLSDNAIRDLSPTIPDALPHLLSLKLSSNRLAEFRLGGVAGLPSLRVLDLSNNQIRELPGKSIDLFDHIWAETRRAF